MDEGLSVMQRMVFMAPIAANYHRILIRFAIVLGLFWTLIMAAGAAVEILERLELMEHMGLEAFEDSPWLNLLTDGPAWLLGLLLIFWFVRRLGRQIDEIEKARLRTQGVEERFLAALDAVPVGIALYDVDDRLVVSNRSYRDRRPDGTLIEAGMTFEEILRDLIDKGSILAARGREEEWIRDRMEMHRNPRGPFEVQREEGWFLANELKLPDGGTLLVTQSISDLKQAQETARASELRFLAVVNHSPAEIYLKDIEGRYLMANRAFEEAYGVREADILGRTAGDHLHPDTASRIMAAEKEVFEKGRAQRFELTVGNADGSARIMSSVSFPVREEGGPVTAIGCISTDVTDRQQAEERLRRQRNLLETVIESIPGAVFWKNRESVFLGCNENFVRSFYKRHRSEIVGRTVRDIAWAPDVAEGAEAVERAVIATGLSRLGVEDTRIEPDGSQRLVRSNTVPLRSDSGEVIGVMGACEDITEWRRSEVQLRKAEKLKSLVGLAGGLAHQLNNLLLPILTLSRMAARKAAEDSKEKAWLGSVVTAAERAKVLIAQVMAFSRQEEAERTLLDAGLVVREALAEIRADLPADISVDERLDDEAVPVLANAEQLKTVLGKLVDNARDAMGGRPGSLDIGLSRVQVDEGLAGRVVGLGHGSYMRLTVADVGCGMEPDVLDRAFEPFFTTKPIGEGTGLGLAIVHGIVSYHDGAIDMRSWPDQGSVIDVYLPLANGQAVGGMEASSNQTDDDEDSLDEDPGDDDAETRSGAE